MSMNAASRHAAREQMIYQQLRAWDVLDPQVLEVFDRVPRETFVPPAYADLAFADLEIPLGQGDRMLAPKVAGRILQAVAPRPTDRVLLVGAGTGYLAACLAARACSVRALELRVDLAAAARHNLETAGTRNALIEQGNAFAAEALGNGAYDVIVLTGSLPLADPRFQRQLALDGRLFVVVGAGLVMDARLVERVGADQWRSTVLFETALKPLVGAQAAERFAF